MNPAAPLTHIWTQCPKCSSILEVLDAQLEQADGWVQCANCRQTFLALSSQVQVNASLTRSEPEHDLGLHSTSIPTSFASQNPESVEHPSKTRSIEQDFHYDGSELKPQLSEPFLATHTLGAGSFKEDPLYHSMASSFSIKPQLIPLGPDSMHPVDSFGGLKPNAQSHLGTFVGFGVALMGLAALLALLTYQNRNILASWAPELKVPLMQACQVLSCQIDWPVDLSALSIEMSAFEHDASDPNLYTLSLKLKNSNSYTVAAPRVRLVLMNDKDQTLLTQSLELSKTSEPRVVHPGALNQWIIPVNLTALSNQSPNGYRLELENP